MVLASVWTSTTVVLGIFTTFGALIAAALGWIIYLFMRGEYYEIPETGELNTDMLSKLFSAMARFGLRTRSILKAVTVTLVIDLLATGASGYALYVVLANRCVPYTELATSNAGNRHLWNYVLKLTAQSPRQSSAANQSTIAGFKHEVAVDFPNVTCP